MKMNANENDDFKNPLELDEEIIQIYIPEENVMGSVISLGAHASIVQYHKDGISYQIEMLNEDLIIIDEIGGIGYETEENL
jgi:nucleoside-triphosphatase THEP1